MADNNDFNRKRKFEEISNNHNFNEDSEMQDANPVHPSTQYGHRYPTHGHLHVDDSKFSENSQDDIIAHDEDSNNSDNVSGDDLMDDMEDDYRPIPKLDAYEPAGIDDSSSQAVMNPADRRNIDKMLDERDMKANLKSKRLPVAMLDQSDFSEDDELARQLRRERQRMTIEHEGIEEDDDAKYLDLEEDKGNITEWIKQARTVKFIRHQFASFLRNFKDDKDVDVYENRISEM